MHLKDSGNCSLKDFLNFLHGRDSRVFDGFAENIQWNFVMKKQESDVFHIGVIIFVPSNDHRRGKVPRVQRR